MISKKWMLCTTFGPQSITHIGLCGSAAAIIDQKLYLTYGFISRDLSDIYMLDLKTWIWKKLETDPKTIPPPRNKHGIWTHESKIIVFGGFGPIPLPQEDVGGIVPFPYLQASTRHDRIDDLQDTRAWNDDLFYFDTETLKHHAIKDIGKRPCPRAAFGYSQYGNSGFLFGGRSQPPGRLNDLYHFCLENYVWTEIKPTGSVPPRRSWLTLTAGYKTMLLIGGLGASDETCPDVWTFDIPKVQSEIRKQPNNSVIEFKNLWKKCSNNFKSPSWSACPQIERPRMWHTTCYNRFHGEFLIQGGAFAQPNTNLDMNEEQVDILSSHFFTLKLSTPSLVDTCALKVPESLRRSAYFVPYIHGIYDTEYRVLWSELEFLIRAFRNYTDITPSSDMMIGTVIELRTDQESLLKLMRAKMGRDDSSVHSALEKVLVMQNSIFISLFVRVKQLWPLICDHKESYFLQRAAEELLPILNPDPMSIQRLRLNFSEGDLINLVDV